MTTTDIKKFWLETYQRLSDEAATCRNSQSVSFGLLAVYDELSASEKECVHRIVADWFVSADNKLRYDASFLTSQRRIVEMTPAIERAIEKTEGRSGPEAKYELTKLMRILDELNQQPPADTGAGGFGAELE